MKTIFTALLAFICLSSFAQNKFIAHRGASNLAPENTVISAKKAWELGADAVECDIYRTKDNRVMVIHDKDTKRTSNGKKSLDVTKTPSILLRDLDVGVWKGDEFKGEKIPFLYELLETVPEGKTLYVEIKCGVEVIPALKRNFDKYGKLDQVVFITFNFNTIEKIHKFFPDNKCFWLSSNRIGLEKKMEEASEIGLTGIDLKSSVIDEKIMVLAKSLNLEVEAWTVDDPDEAKRLTGLGVTGITTNRPKWLKEEMQKQ